MMEPVEEAQSPHRFPSTKSAADAVVTAVAVAYALYMYFDVLPQPERSKTLVLGVIAVILAIAIFDAVRGAVRLSGGHNDADEIHPTAGETGSLLPGAQAARWGGVMLLSVAFVLLVGVLPVVLLISVYGCAVIALVERHRVGFRLAVGFAATIVLLGVVVQLFLPGPWNA